ncbi:DUF222 domain-containing protein, partial [Microbispora sp. GKU 823]|uniref:DUF222 domain-containing protein n=1 Tax=Microbispora sp. GKU 823 TaxID=1652100 RepID=UPI001180B31A
GLEGEFCLPREAAARLRALLDAYAKPRAEGDDRPLRVRNADAFIALLEQEIATELLVLVNAESLPADPEDAAHADNTPDDTADPSDTEDTEDTDTDTGDAEDAGDQSPRDTESAHDPIDAATGHPEDTSGPGGMSDPGDVAGTDPSESQSDEWQSPDPPPEDNAVHHTHAGHRPAGNCRHAQATREGHGHGHRRHGESGCACGRNTRCSSAAPETPQTAGTASGVPGPKPETPPGAPGPEMPPGRPPGALGPGPETPLGRPLGSPLGSPPGAAPWTASGTAPGASPGAPPGVLPGALLGTAPGLLLATGQMLPVSSVHRLARTSTLVRLVMDADGQVLDMGRKVRLATPAQRRAIFARYATCW